MLPAPALADFNWLGAESLSFAEPFDHARRLTHGTPREAPWPQLSMLPLENAAITLPAPEESLFEMPDGLRAALQSVAVSSRHVEPAASSALEQRTKLADTSSSRRFGRGKSRFGHRVARNQRHGTSRVAGRGTRIVAPGHRGPLKHLVAVKKRHV